MDRFPAPNPEAGHSFGGPKTASRAGGPGAPKRAPKNGGYLWGWCSKTGPISRGTKKCSQTGSGHRQRVKNPRVPPMIFAGFWRPGNGPLFGTKPRGRALIWRSENGARGRGPGGTKKSSLKWWIPMGMVLKNRTHFAVHQKVSANLSKILGYPL